MWDRMRTLCGEWLGPWLVIGDFNETLWQYEHFSQHPRLERQMVDFREIISHWDLNDLDFSGLPWTYNNSKGGDRNVHFCLDRQVANMEGIDIFLEANVHHLMSSQYDHKSLTP